MQFSYLSAIFLPTSYMAALSILLCLHLCFICSVSSELGTTSDMKELCVGLELHNETLPLQMGSRYYKLIGLKPLHWYEVKISYPASIPASFSIELKRGDFEQERAFSLRRLLNTGKLIFRSGGHSLENNEDTSEGALVYVQPEGVVAKPHLKERKFVMFNIGKEFSRSFYTRLISYPTLGTELFPRYGTTQMGAKGILLLSQSLQLMARSLAFVIWLPTRLTS
ncbi:uncharacterized protein LOC116252637 isoform X3 [Nymphaea colorata]|nr:uncharacterized protein LOC116252637 isoform X3 [Nymphaea colorata]XP_031482899.1 uncharacterized protein LOC116252637 isoform X3 [Nymphaea colorata]